ncbi:MAG: N-acetyltransferase [Planctomycetales bacterium]|nr:N-acetyltransferase [Planctomycetales bacterium]
MIHPTALVDDAVEIPACTNIWAYCHILRGARIGTNVNIGDHCFVEGGAVVGNDVTIKNGVFVWEGVVIENGVFVGPNVTFTNDCYPRSPRMDHAATRYKDKSWLVETVLRTGSSIGAAAVILPGVEIGCFGMVGAGSVVSRDVPAFSLVVGNPARVVADLCCCGQKLEGSCLTESCSACGQTPLQRQALLQELISSSTETAHES